MQKCNNCGDTTTDTKSCEVGGCIENAQIHTCATDQYDCADHDFGHLVPA